MSANLNSIAVVLIGDAADSTTESVTTSAQTFSLPEKLRGRVLRFSVAGGICYLSANDRKSETAADPSATAGVAIADGSFQDFYIPDGRNVYEYKAVGSAALTLKIDVLSP